MGDFDPFRSEAIHDVLLDDAQGERLGVIRISREITLRESWDHLESQDDRVACEPAGPHNRRLVPETTSYLVYGSGWNVPIERADDPPPAPIPEIVAALGEHEGLEGIPYTDPRFPAACAEWVESSHGVKLTFRAAGGGLC